MAGSSQILAHLAVVLDADTASWGKGLDAARDKMASSGAAINKSLASIEKNTAALQSSLKGLATVGAMLWLKGATSAALDNASSIAEQAKQAGIATGAFQELEYAQRQNGGSQESWNKGIAHFTTLIGDAAKGSQSAVQALRNVGITQQDLLSQNVEQLYTRASDALSQYADAGRRASDAQDLFGKAAKTSGNAFALSAEELRQLREEAIATGQVLDEQTVASAKRAQDELDKFSKKISVELTRGLVEIAPLLVKTAQFIGDVAEMAGFAARRIGLIASSTNEQRYEALLQKFTDINDELAFFNERTGRGEIIGGGDLVRVNKLKEELTAVNEQMAAMRASGQSGAPTQAPAAAKVSPIGGAAQGEGFDKLLHDMEKRHQQFQATVTQDEATQMFARVDIARQEWQFKADQLKLNLEQRAQFNAELDTLISAQLAAEDTRLQEQRAREIAASVARYEGLVSQYEQEYALEIQQRDALLELDAVYQEMGIEQDARYEEIKNKIHEDGLAKRYTQARLFGVSITDFNKMNMGQQVQFMTGALTNITAIGANESKKQFDLNKKAGIANALVSTYQGAAAALQWGFPMGPIFAALMIAMGLKQVSSIKSQQFSGGGAGAAAPSMSVSAAPPVEVKSPDLAQAPQQSGPAVRRNINVYLQGSGRYSSEEVRELIGQINDEQADGTRVEAFN